MGQLYKEYNCPRILQQQAFILSYWISFRRWFGVRFDPPLAVFVHAQVSHFAFGGRPIDE